MGSSPSDNKPYYSGRCACGTIRYSRDIRPIRIHACHCHYCQRETGSAFALNAIYEAQAVRLTTSTNPDYVKTPTQSGKGQTIARCPNCRVAVWSSYGAHAGESLRIIRVGTLDDPVGWNFVPDMHIYTADKQPWVTLDPSVPSVNGFYEFKDYWPNDKLERLAKALKGHPSA